MEAVLFVVPYGLFALHHYWPSSIPEFLKLSLRESVFLSLLFFIVERLLDISGRIRQIEVAAEKRVSLRVHAKREDAYNEILSVLETRNARQIDLIQVSGTTARKLVRKVISNNPNAVVRLLLANRDNVSKYNSDGAGFHESRIDATIGDLRLIQREYPNATVGIKYYTTDPGISGILIDDWLVSVGWYPVFKTATGTISIRGHVSPEITAFDEDIEPLQSMARDQFIAVWTSGTGVLSFGPMVSEIAW